MKGVLCQAATAGIKNVDTQFKKYICFRCQKWPVSITNNKFTKTKKKIEKYFLENKPRPRFFKDKHVSYYARHSYDRDILRDSSFSGLLRQFPLRV